MPEFDIEIVHDYPPNYANIIAAIPAVARHPQIIFTYGHTIYSPMKQKISKPLIAHEIVHAVRQGTKTDDITAWWDRYLRDQKFRLQEELLAHLREYRFIIDEAGNRNQRRAALKQTARRLSSPIYAMPINFAQARKMIKTGKIPANMFYTPEGGQLA